MHKLSLLIVSFDGIVIGDILPENEIKFGESRRFADPANP
jgi:hypothetical protein